MYLTKFWLLVFCACVLAADDATVSGEDSGSQDSGLEDFPLDDTREDDGSVNADPEERGIEEDTEDGGHSSILNSLEDQQELFTTEEGKQELLKKVMIAAMSRPGARQRLAQVMPILRTMSSAQRLALATLVTSQLMAPPGATPPPLNTTKNNLTEELMLPISMDIASMFRGLGREAASARSALHRGSEIIRARYPPYRRRPILTSNNRRTTNIAVDMKPPPPPPMYPRITPPRVKLPPSKLLINRFPPSTTRDQTTDERQQPGKDCEYFTHSVCLEVSNYPTDDIMESIRNTPNKASLEALLSDSKQNIRDIVPEEDNSMDRRQGDVSLTAEDNGHMCSSKVQVARPKRARTTSGQWKYIVNTGDYTQTLRMEMCLKPMQTCSYLSENYKSHCKQVYNYHRLLTWDQKSGLTMDIFKVPTCCSCHVQGYSYAFTPGETIQGSRNPQPPPSLIAANNPIPQPPLPPPREIGPYLERPETNFVRDETPVLHRLPPTKYLTRVRPSSQIPKREGVTKRPIVHRGPPLPLQHERETPMNFRYPPYDNMVRRTTTRNNNTQDEIVNSIRPFFPVRPTPNQRHPELPVDNIISETELAAVTAEVYTTPATIISTTQHTTPPSSKRINYSYHPIIDFFKTGVSAVAFEERIDNDDWTPITDGPRVIPK